MLDSAIDRTRSFFNGAQFGGRHVMSVSWAMFTEAQVRLGKNFACEWT